MLLTDPFSLAFWHVLTRLGEAQILLPAAALSILALAHQRQGRQLASRWLVTLAAAVALTTASKVAFIGWGIGWSALDFTGVSGHAMFAAAVYPLLLGTLAPATPRVAPWLAMAAGATLAMLVGVSRVTLHAHSWSEVAAGLALGGTVGVISLMQGHLTECRFKLWVPMATVAWLMVMPVHAPASNSHALVTRMALALSGRHNPYTRDELRRKVPAFSIKPAPITVPWSALAR
jgi:membrane-associated phospholipid phosphatase